MNYLISFAIIAIIVALFIKGSRVWIFKNVGKIVTWAIVFFLTMSFQSDIAGLYYKLIPKFDNQNGRAQVSYSFDAATGENNYHAEGAGFNERTGDRMAPANQIAEAVERCIKHNRNNPNHFREVERYVSLKAKGGVVKVMTGHGLLAHLRLVFPTKTTKNDVLGIRIARKSDAGGPHWRELGEYSTRSLPTIQSFSEYFFIDCSNLTEDCEIKIIYTKN